VQDPLGQQNNRVPHSSVQPLSGNIGQELMNRLMKFFGAGKIYKSRDTVCLHITKLEDLNEKVIPFFEKYKITGIKSKDYSDFKKVAELMNNKAHLTSEGLEEIHNIKIGMNKGRL
jgi:hypothetical protein